jgi:hypothetical protein
MTENRRQLLAATCRLMRELRMTDDREVRFETLEKLALMNEVAQDLVAYERKLITELDVD